MTASQRGPAPDFPVLDASRYPDGYMLGRMILDTFGFLEPYIGGETDSWISLPLRLVHDQAAGWHLELGPYDLGAADIDALRAAIAGYDQAAGIKPSARRAE